MRNLFRSPERLTQQRNVAGISHVQRATIDDEIEEGFQLGIPESSSRFGQVPGHVFQKMEDLIGADVLQEFLRMNRIEPVKQESVAINGPLFMVRLKITGVPTLIFDDTITS